MHLRRVVRFLAVLFVLLVFAAGCGDDGGGETDPSSDDDVDATGATAASAASSTTAAIPEGGEAITGLSLTRVAFGDGAAVTLTNDSEAEITVDGLWLCNRPSYIELSGAIPAGGTLDVDGADLGGLNIEGGEAALYSSNDFGSSDDILDYVQWGTGGGRESVAVGAGLWPEGGSVEPDPEFGSIEKFDVAGGPEAWE